MPEGWRGPDDPTGSETFRRLPIDPVDEALRTPPEADSEVPESFSTEIQGLRSGIGSGSGSGSSLKSGSAARFWSSRTGGGR